jgi:hypothetical protein
MDKVEQYLDQVCRSVGGPRSLRQHIRQELREHLLDAMAEHKAAGLPEEEALNRALADFGGPEQVRSELEATHGQRLLPVVIDKAMQWKEKTMRAKWLWTTWAYLAVAGIILLDLLFIAFAVTTQIPKLRAFTAQGWLQYDDTPGVVWLVSFLHNVQWAWERAIWWAPITAAGWGLFEWRVRSENKSFMRLSGLGTVGFGLTIVVLMTAGAVVLPYAVGIPHSSIARPFAREQIVSVDASIVALEQAAARKDWDGMREHAEAASEAANRLGFGPSLHSLKTRNEPLTLAELRAHQESAMENLAEAQQAIRGKDAERLKAAPQKFQQSFGPLREAAKKREG